jgi:hypothetical protein
MVLNNVLTRASCGEPAQLFDGRPVEQRAFQGVGAVILEVAARDDLQAEGFT